MSKKAKKYKVKKTLLFIGLVIIFAFGTHYLKNGNKNQNNYQIPEKDSEIDGNKNQNNYQIPEKDAEIGCSRTSRLENKPAFDRALSLIEERYKMWEDSGESIGSWYFFPSQLVNCIQIVEEDLNSDAGLEGYFVFNSEDIKDNYFPIVVDNSYKYSDESVNSLLLVHEITHVYQYLEELKNEKRKSCFDKEAEAFYAQMKFYSIQYSEARKSIDFRIENDQDLHPQLQMIKIIKNLGLATLDDVREKCLYGEGKNDEYCIDNFRKNSIKEMLQLDDFYKNQCK